MQRVLISHPLTKVFQTQGDVQSKGAQDEITKRLCRAELACGRVRGAGRRDVPGAGMWVRHQWLQRQGVPEGERRRRRERRIGEDAQLEAGVIETCNYHLQVVLVTMGRKDLLLKRFVKGASSHFNTATVCVM